MGEAQEATAKRSAAQGSHEFFQAAYGKEVPIATHYILDDVTELKRFSPGWVRVGDTCSCNIIADRVLMAFIGDADEIDDDANVLIAGSTAWVVLSAEQKSIDEHVKLSARVVNLTLTRAKS